MADDKSDFLGYLKLWDFFGESIKHKKSNRKLAQELAEQFLSQRRLREWRDIHSQLAGLVTELGMHPNETPATPEQIHRALLGGLLGNIGFKTEEGEYLGARGIKFTIFPGSGLRKAQPKWVMAGGQGGTPRADAGTGPRIAPR